MSFQTLTWFILLQILMYFMGEVECSPPACLTGHLCDNCPNGLYRVIRIKNCPTYQLRVCCPGCSKNLRLTKISNRTLSCVCPGNGYYYEYTTYGDIRNLNPSGKLVGGIEASYTDVDRDLGDLERLKSFFVSAGQASEVHPALIAAMASRETRGGRLINRTNGWGDRGNAYGLLQCDIRYHNDCEKYAWNSEEHITQMIQDKLVPYIKQVAKKHPTWIKEQQLQGAVAAYNFGVKNVQTWGKFDKGTHNNDYSNDVIARALRLINKHHW